MNFYNKIQSIQNLEVQLSEEAKMVYKEYYNELQDKKTMTDDDYSRGIYAKLSIQCLRWALSLHILEWAVNTVKDKSILPKETMSYAIKCMHHFESTALKVKGLINGDSSLSQINKQDVLRKLFEFYPSIVQSELARALHFSPQFISKSIK